MLPLCPPTLFAFCVHFIIITFSLNDELVICSLNVRGLSNSLKRRETFRWLKMKKYGIFFFKRSTVLKKKNLFGRRSGASPLFLVAFPVRVCILFNNNFQLEIIRQFSDQEGRYIIIDMKIDNKILTLGKKCSNNQNFTTLEKATDNLFSSEKVCKTFYQILIKRKTSSPVKSQGKWLAEDLFPNVQVNWENTYQLPFLCTTETKLRVFQFKFLHRRVATNDFLLRIGKKETDSCSVFALIPQRHLRIFFGTVDQLRLSGIMFRSGPPKSLT